MRVIAGKARSLRLKSIEGMDTRPTTDRIKETLFNMIHDGRARCCAFLDLVSAAAAASVWRLLSRGARRAVLVESSRKAAACIQDNIEVYQVWLRTVRF